MQKLYKNIACSISIWLILCVPSQAQHKELVHWLSFEQLEDSLAIKPKKVFIDFYTDWCTYCRKMDKEVFTKSDVIDVLNKEYYAVRFNAETDSTIIFSGQQLINDQVGKSRTPIHQIAQLLAYRQGSFVAPTFVFLDETFAVKSRHFTYLSSRKLLKVLAK